MHQIEMNLAEGTPDAANVAYLVRMLDEHRGWMTADDIGRLVDGHWNDRQVRRLAAAAMPMVISGQRGYRHIRHASAEEIDHAANWLESQACEMTRRALSIRRRAHELVG